MIRQNRNRITKLKDLFAQPGTHFVIVGTGHLVGEVLSNPYQKEISPNLALFLKK
jgi:hypothetical protein